MQWAFLKAKNICNNWNFQESAKTHQHLQINDGTDTRTQMRALRFSMSVVATHLICIFLLRLHGSLVRHCGAFFSHLLQNQRSLNHPIASSGRARPVCFLVQPWHWGYWHCRQYFNRSLRPLANASRDCNFLQRAHQIGLHRFCSQYHDCTCLKRYGVKVWET